MRSAPLPVNVIRRGTGLPVVTIHGNGVDHRLMLPLDGVLGEVGGFERIYLDLPGYGTTPALSGAAGLPELADWTVDQVRELVGDRPFALLAISMGGLLARHVRAHLPDQVRGIALLSPVVDPDHRRRTLPTAQVIECDRALVDSLSVADREEFTAMSARQTQPSWELFERFALPGIRAADQAAMTRLAARYQLEEVPEQIAPPLTGPTLIVTGRQDDTVGFVDQFSLLEHYPRATYAVLDGAGHNVHLDQPEAVAALVRAWAAHVHQDVAPHRAHPR